MPLISLPIYLGPPLRQPQMHSGSPKKRKANASMSGKPLTQTRKGSSSQPPSATSSTRDPLIVQGSFLDRVRRELSSVQTSVQDVAMGGIISGPQVQNWGIWGVLAGTDERRGIGTSLEGSRRVKSYESIPVFSHDG